MFKYVPNCTPVPVLSLGCPVQCWTLFYGTTGTKRLYWYNVHEHRIQMHLCEKRDYSTTVLVPGLPVLVKKYQYKYWLLKWAEGGLLLLALTWLEIGDPFVMRY